MTTSKPNILIAMSGGVDSSVSALIAKQAGLFAVGGTMRLFDFDLLSYNTTSKCFSTRDVSDAKNVCHKLKIPHYTFDCKDTFKQKVVSPFVKSYQQGKTPNPCIACNKHLKFDELIKKAKTLGIDLVATGHYANIKKQNGKLLLKRGADLKKDQSYVLYVLTKEQLEHIVFPIGELTKQEVRDIASKCNLEVAEKKESQDICFIPDGNVEKFISAYLGDSLLDENKQNGKIVNELGDELGAFNFNQAFTIGQRKGLNIACGHPVYITDIDRKNNVITVGEKQSLIKSKIETCNFNWISITPKLNDKISCTAKIRYNMKDVCATVSNITEKTCTVTFANGISAPAKGQSIVLYDGDVVLGGGIINETY